MNTYFESCLASRTLAAYATGLDFSRDASVPTRTFAKTLRRDPMDDARSCISSVLYREPMAGAERSTVPSQSNRPIRAVVLLALEHVPLEWYPQ
jgi:hypothetical protein